jgi:hypothetical protein
MYMGRYYNNYVMDTLLPGARKEATLSLNLALINFERGVFNAP